MRYSILAGLLTLVGAVSSANLELFESLRSIPEGWQKVGAPDFGQRMHFRIALKQPNHKLFEQTLMQISTPSHPKYGQHLKRHELKALVRPKAESTDAVLQWLKESGVKGCDIQNDGDWVNFIVPIPTANEMMNTSFDIYQSTVRPDLQRIRTLQYSIPSELHEHIDLIQPTTRFGQIRPDRVTVLDKEILGVATADAADVPASCNRTVTPACLKQLYNFDSYKPDPNAKVKLGVNGFLEEYARFSDLATFEQKYAQGIAGTNFTWTSVNGGTLPQNSQNDSVEANLDIQYTVGLVGPGISTNFYSTPGRGLLVPDLDQPNPDANQNEPYLDLFTYLVGLNDSSLPQVLSTSYGEDEQSVPESYSRKVCDLIGQLGSRGVSVIFSSGDSGVGSGCQTNDGKNTTRFNPTFPASCPYVTAVGGTHYVEPEQAIYFSSGGFSDRFTRPDYQEKAVSAYLQKLGNQWEGLYNPAGRGIPDVAAQGQGFRVVDKGFETSVGGTSASAPTFASVIALLNNARISAGQPALGFLNPWIYSSAYAALNDITLGGSNGCTGYDQYSGLPGSFVAGASWNATEGWDPVTGYGTPDFQKMMKLATSGGYKGRRGMHERY